MVVAIPPVKVVMNCAIEVVVVTLVGIILKRIVWAIMTEMETVYCPEIQAKVPVMVALTKSQKSLRILT